MPVTIDNYNSVRFARVTMPTLTASVLKATWMPKTASYEAFGTVSYSVPAETAQAIRAEMGLASDVRIGVATRSSFEDVQGWTALLASKVGQVYTATGSATLTVGVDATDAVKQSVDKDGNAWVNLTLVFANESGQWVDRPSSLATTSRLLAEASK